MAKRYLIKASKDSNLYFKCFNEIEVIFETSDILGWESSVNLFDSIEEAIETAKIFCGYVVEFEESPKYYYICSKISNHGISTETYLKRPARKLTTNKRYASMFTEDESNEMLDSLQWLPIEFYKIRVN